MRQWGAIFRYLRLLIFLSTLPLPLLAASSGDTMGGPDGTSGAGGEGERRASSKELLWSVIPPPEKLVLLYNHETPLTISTGTKALVNLRLVHSTLQESTTNALLAPDCIHLVSKSSGSRGLNLEAGKKYSLGLRIDEGCAKEGVYQGSVSLATDTAPDEKSFKITVLSTSWKARALGGLMIALGIGLSWIVTVLLRNRALRVEALIPAVELRAVARRILRDVVDLQASTQTTLSIIQGQLARVEAELSDKSLETEAYIPRGIPNPFKAWTDRTADYRAFLGERSRELSLLEEIRVGMREAFKPWSADPQVENAVRTALSSIDAEAQNLSSPERVRQKISAALATLGNTLGLGGGNRLAEAPSTVALRVEIHRLSLATWLLWGLVTWMLGYMILVSSNYGFGIGLDFFKCFFWGLGLQVAGQQLQQFTPSSISNVFSLSFPKA